MARCPVYSDTLDSLFNRWMKQLPAPAEGFTGEHLAYLRTAFMSGAHYALGAVTHLAEHDDDDDHDSCSRWTLRSQNEAAIFLRSLGTTGLLSADASLGAAAAEFASRIVEQGRDAEILYDPNASPRFLVVSPQTAAAARAAFDLTDWSLSSGEGGRA